MEGIGILGLASSLVGYVGACWIIVAYFLNQRGLLRSDDWRFPAMNLLGSLLVLVSLLYQPNLPSVFIELFWSSISLYGVQRAVLRKRRAADPET